MEPKFLKGTGTLKGFETEVMDTYLHKNVRERQNYDFINEELWEFLKERYGANHTVKRYYVGKGSYYSLCEVEARFKMIPVWIVRADDLYQGNCSVEGQRPSYVQLSAKKNYTEMKKRLADVITA